MKWFWWFLILVVGQLRSAAGSSASGGDQGAGPADPGSPAADEQPLGAEAADPLAHPATGDTVDGRDGSTGAVETAEIPNSVLDSGYDPRLATQVMGMTPEPSSQAPVPGAAGEGGDPGSTTDPDKKAAPSDAPGDATAGATDADEEIDSGSQH